MKNPKQKLKNILLLVTVLFAFSCSKDAYEENLNLDQETSVKTTRVSLNQVLIDLNNTAIKKNLNELIIVNSQINSANRVGNSEIYFTKKEKADVLVTYLLNINSYSQEKPYFLKLIITNNANEQCKIGYLKYVPTSTETSLDLQTFTGEVQILNFNFEITAKSNYINGIKQQDDNTSSRITCVNEINVTEVKCSHTGNHGVGETCRPPLINDAHFVVTIFERCTSRSGDLVQIIEDTSGGNSDPGGIFPASIILNPFLDTLTSEELEIYYSSPLLQEYLLNNIVVVPNPAFNPLTGGDPNLIIIDPEVESSVKNFITSLAQSGNSTWLINQTTQTKDSIFNYLITNSFSDESESCIDEAINYCETNGNTPEVLEEINNTLSLFTNGTVNGLPVDLGDSTPITNMANYLSCFNTTQGAVLTIAADQPDAGDHDLFTLNGGVGHSFITIKQGNKVRSLGFYPKSGAQSIVPNTISPNPNDFYNVPGEFHNNENTSYDVSLSVPITASQLSNLINGTVNFANNNPVYNLSSLNCTDIAIVMFETNTPVNLPSCESPNILWDGQTPGTLGEVLRDLPTPTGGTKDTNGGTSPQNNG